MKTFPSIWSLATLSALSLAAHAQSAKIGEAVKTEPAPAQRNANIPAPSGSAPSAWGAKTRAQVEAETLEAIRTGDMLPAGDGGLTLKERFPGKYPK
jgi:hypothetical protein